MPPREPRTAVCEGQRAIIVTNNWNRGVDVYATSAGSTPPIILGSVLPGGRDEFVLPFESLGAFTRSTDQSRGGYPTEREVQIRYLCRR